jgi:hypothetical protein
MVRCSPCVSCVCIGYGVHVDRRSAVTGVVLLMSKCVYVYMKLLAIMLPCIRRLTQLTVLVLNVTAFCANMFLYTAGHAVVVVAEGAGEELLGENTTEVDASGNKKLPKVKHCSYLLLLLLLVQKYYNLLLLLVLL